MDLRIFSQLDFLPAIRAFFVNLNVEMNYVADEPTSAKEILKDTYKDHETFQLMDDVYFVGMVDDAAFEGNKSLEADKIKSDYDGILIFGVTLKSRPNGLLPTRSQLAEISRAFNREFYYTPVVVVFKYENYLAFANTERLKYKQEWREGEKAGKVSLLRDIHIEKPHSGHERILAELKITTTGKKKVDSFVKLYTYWQEVFSVSLLNKKFYQELSNWYFWATQHVTFPGEPSIADAHHKNAKLEDLLQEHRATNVIRMLTRLLFVWFIKEKKLIPEELFELDALQKDILNEISPYHERGMFKERNKESVYYKAVLQNLFFATLNCPIEGDNLDKRKRGFRGEGYGTHRGIDYLMRYKQYFKNPDAFLEKLNETVPFLNGGLFECLDDKFNNIYIDGFSDQMTKGEQLIVPDYLFFGVEEETDLSDIVGITDKKYKQAAVKGLINILKSYKFTITENTPIEEDVALDPELLGKVFENLLASYNPETKTTARKQTGSFYTPREIVNYMVDESLIAYLKNKITSEPSVFLEFGAIQADMFGNEGKKGQTSLVADVGGSELKNDENKLDLLLHELVSFNPGNPFATYPDTSKQLLKYLSECTILDPACGSGSFPMGILQKTVHILQKLYPGNKVWKEVQLEKARKESEAAFEIEDKQAREEQLLEINEAFDQSINDPDYARKLFLIENCIYGVDIQPIATQISKLRFFISLVVEQKVNAEKDNFGIRPLPNLETKFVAANTLVGIERPKAGDQLKIGNDVEKIEGLKKELALTRHKLFSARTKDTKLKYRQKDLELRTKIASELKDNFGWTYDSAEKLSRWDPYDQNASSSFFDSEWMFDIQEGFDVVIGNPPYVRPRTEETEILAYLRKNYDTAHNQLDLFHLFIEFAVKNINKNGINCYIISNAFLANENTEPLRNYILNNTSIISIVDLKEQVFEGASVDTIVYLLKKSSSNSNISSAYVLVENNNFSIKHLFNQIDFKNNVRKNFTISLSSDFQFAFNSIRKISTTVNSYFHVTTGIKEYQVGKGTPPQLQADKENRVFNSNSKIDDSYLPELRGKNLNPFNICWNGEHVKYGPWLAEPRQFDFFNGKKILIRKIPSKNRLVLSVHTKDMIVDQSIYVGKKKSNNEVDEYYAVGILSSKLLHWYFKTFNNETDDLFPQIKTKQFKELPIKNNIAFRSSIIIISQILHFNVISNILDVLDALIFNLYFHDHMKERDIDVLEFVERDIDEVMHGREFEKLSDTEKEQVIEDLHAKWSHPDNEVRNRIKLFAVRSPEILKPILES